MLAIVLIGIPGSGKSTLSGQIVEASSGNLLPLSLDHFRQVVNGDENDNSNFFKVKKAFNQSLRNAKQDVIIDNTNCKTSYRKNICGQLKSLGYTDIVGLVVECTVEQSLRNQKNRERKVSREVVGRMYHNLSHYPPSLEEGFTSIHYIEG